MQRAAILPFAACLAPAYFLHVINSTIFGKKVTEHKMCILIFSATFI
jgi:hypothetical protein